MATSMKSYKVPIHIGFPGVSALKIRYQTLEISDGQARVFADVVFHNLSPDECKLSLQQVTGSLRPSSAHLWISSIEISNQVLSCKATAPYHDIKLFKSLELQQTAAAASENGVAVSQNDLARISSIEDGIKVALEICPSSTVKGEAEYHPTFQYHVVEDAILRVNGWECLRRVQDRVAPIEDDEWLVKQKNRLLKQFPWISAFNPPRDLLEYGLKFLTPAPGTISSSELRRKMLTKALQGRTSLLANSKADLGHAFCIAVLLIAIYQCKSD
jgi:hypothetical protein